MKRIIMLVAMLSMMLLSFGTANAVLGVADDVPGTDVVIPIICEKGGSLDTVWSVFNTFVGGASAELVLFDRFSNSYYDEAAVWTPDDLDVLSDGCQDLMARANAVARTHAETTIDGKVYYTGYVIYFNNLFPDFDEFVPNVYLVDLTKGFASGFNGFAVEGEVTPTLAEFDSVGAVEAPVTAFALFPRYFILNDKPNTWNWWIILAGTNEDPLFPRSLDGFICNEDEVCNSVIIPIPDELNVINPADFIPGGLFTAFPHAGYGYLFVDPYSLTDTILGWSYQRQEADTTTNSWDVVHPMSRIY